LHLAAEEGLGRPLSSVLPRVWKKQPLLTNKNLPNLFDHQGWNSGSRYLTIRGGILDPGIAATLI
jgi:hypothetical protein